MSAIKLPALATVLMLSVQLSAQKKQSVTTPYLKEIQQLATLKSVQAAFTAIDQLEPTTQRELIELTEIPAPPFQEARRAVIFKQLLQDAGADNVWIDSVGNVLAIRKGKKATKTVALDAHLDTVFPEGTDVNIKHKGDTLYAPGIGDDTRGLVTILAVLKALEKARIETSEDVLFVASVGEEGLGDLRGVKYLFKKNDVKIDSWISVDGEEIKDITNGALGSVRYKVTIKGPGGHSWSAFGLGNPHHALGKAIDAFAEEAATFTSTPGGRTSFNVGRIGGGTSINAIPFESWMEVDMRSESPDRLKQIETIFTTSVTKALKRYNATVKRGTPLTMTLEKIGYRPSGLTSDTNSLVQKAMAAVRYFNHEPTLNVVSTNANVPISLGIPAITIGPGGRAGNAHALNEYYLNENGAEGIKFTLLTLLLEAGVAK
ncbi:MAG: peptidase M20 [Cytophaga sp.]|nr:peptidase M20 [Cytophaga sp.]